MEPQKAEILDHLESFLYDFTYSRIAGKEVFEHGFSTGNKLVLLNITPYSDGLMVEVLLGLQFYKVEEIMHLYSDKVFHPGDISLTYWVGLSTFSEPAVSRNFISNKNDAQQTLSEIEQLLVKKGFYWLDEFSNERAISDEIRKSILDKRYHHKNLYFLCKRSLILMRLLKEPVTDELFYSYYEALQLHKVPDSQLEDFLEFRKYLQDISIF